MSLYRAEKIQRDLKKHKNFISKHVFSNDKHVYFIRKERTIFKSFWAIIVRLKFSILKVYYFIFVCEEHSRDIFQEVNVN